jgi:hypothetical protein
VAGLPQPPAGAEIRRVDIIVEMRSRGEFDIE